MRETALGLCAIMGGIMSITNANQLVRQDGRLRLAVCFLVPAVLMAAHFMHGADTLVATAWTGVMACAGLGCIILMRPATDVPLATLLLFALLTAFVMFGWTGNWYQARTEIIQLAIAIVFWTSGAMIARSRDMLMTSWAVLSAGFACIALLAVLSYPMMSADSSSEARLGHAFRLSFTFGSPNTLGSLMGLGVIVSAMHLAYLLRARVATGIPILAKLNYIPREGYASIFALLLCATCLLLSLSRAAIFLTLAFLAATSALEVFVRRKSETLNLAGRRYQVIGCIGLAFLLVLAFTLTVSDIGERADDLHIDGAGRWALLSEYWQAWQQRPVFGHGLGSFNRVNESITTMDNAAMLVLLGAAHNVVLQWLIQTGLAGLAAMAAVQFLFHYRILQGARQRSYRTRAYLSRTVLFASAFLFLHNMIDFPLEIPSVMWTYAFLLGLACGMPDGTELKGSSPD